MWKIISTDEYDKMKKELDEYKESSGENELNRLKKLAKIAAINEHSEEFQSIMTRAFLAVAGRENEVLRAYSGTAFLKDNSEEILQRLDEFKKQASVMTRQLENKSKKCKNDNRTE